MGDLDFLTFCALVERTTRSVYEDRISETWARHVASQGRTKDVKKFVAPWKKALGGRPERQRRAERRRKAGSLKDLMGVLKKTAQQ